MMPRMVEFLKTRLPELPSDGYVVGAKHPLEQLDDELTDFIADMDWPTNLPPKTLSPQDDGIWEMRCPDLRVFGWFWRRGVFIASAVAIKQQLRQKVVSYAGYIKQAKHDRDQLGLDNPLFITGGIDDVV